jgi:hypothetical protein
LRGPALRETQGRLERLHASLEALALRLREGIAGLVGGHVGDAARDALRAALGRPPTAVADSRTQADHSFAASVDDPDGFTPLWAEEPAPPPATPAHPSRRGWRSVLAGGLQLAGWWLSDRARRPLRRWLGLGAAAALALAGGPVAAGLLAAVGVAATMTKLADGAAISAGTLAGVTSS